MATPLVAFTVLVGLLPNNRVLLQVAKGAEVLAYVELDKAGAFQISGQLAAMAAKLETEQ